MIEYSSGMQPSLILVAASLPHRHPGSEISCVPDGTIVNQFASEMPTACEQSQIWPKCLW